jgi:mannose-6-phosphate isomerase-like protein (cupin superfamily)
MTAESINLRRKLSHFSDHWSPKVIAELNDYQIKLVKLEGEFVWHQHDDTDELFFCLEGSLVIELPDDSVSIQEGEMFVVPKGVEHRPIAAAECHVMLIEPKGVINTGSAGGDLTAPENQWV